MESIIPTEVLCNIDKYSKLIKREFILNQIPISPVQVNHKTFTNQLKDVCCYVAAINELILDYKKFIFKDTIKFAVLQNKILKRTLNIAISIGATTLTNLDKPCIAVLKNYYKMVGWKIQVHKINNKDIWEFTA